MASVDNENNGGVETEPAPASTGQIHLDLFKHLTTLSAGSLVLIATFLKDIFPKKDGGLLDVGVGLELLIGASLMFLGVSLLSSVWFMLQLSNKTTWEHPEATVLAYIRSLVGKGFQTTSLLAFLAGILCFGAAVLINLF